MNKIEHSKRIMRKALESADKVTSVRLQSLVPYSYSTFRRAAQDLGLKKIREGFGAGGKWYYGVPEGGLPAVEAAPESQES